MLVELSGIWLVLLDGFAWVALHLGIAYLCCRVPTQRLDYRRWLFRTRDWERGGTVYQAVLRIRKWKSLLPSGGPALGADFSLARVESRDRDRCSLSALESACGCGCERRLCDRGQRAVHSCTAVQPPAGSGDSRTPSGPQRRGGGSLGKSQRKKVSNSPTDQSVVPSRAER
jgi:hypothetical protein